MDFETKLNKSLQKSDDDAKIMSDFLGDVIAKVFSIFIYIFFIVFVYFWYFIFLFTNRIYKFIKRKVDK